MIKEIEKNEIPECVNVIRKSFQTVADEFGFTPENAPRFTAFATTEEWLVYQLEYEHRLMASYYDDDGKILKSYCYTGDKEKFLNRNNAKCKKMEM